MKIFRAQEIERMRAKLRARWAALDGPVDDLVARAVDLTYAEKKALLLARHAAARQKQQLDDRREIEETLYASPPVAVKKRTAPLSPGALQERLEALEEKVARLGGWAVDRSEHRCGVRGFSPYHGDVCPACAR